MHWFLIIYMFSTDELLIKEFNTKKECVITQSKLKKALMKDNKDVKDITCEEGQILDYYAPEGDNEKL